MAWEVIQEPTALAISVTEAKQHCEYLDTDRDAYFEDLIRAATDTIERQLEMTIMERTLRVTYDLLTDEMELPFGPVTNVLQVQYYDKDGQVQTLSPTLYTLDRANRTNWIIRNQGLIYPVTVGAVSAVRIDYKAGYSSMPIRYASLKHAIKLLVGHYFANREAVTIGSGPTFEVPLGVQSLLHPFRQFHV